MTLCQVPDDWGHFSKILTWGERNMLNFLKIQDTKQFFPLKRQVVWKKQRIITLGKQDMLLYYLYFREDPRWLMRGCDTQNILKEESLKMQVLWNEGSSHTQKQKINLKSDPCGSNQGFRLLEKRRDNAMAGLHPPHCPGSSHFERNSNSLRGGGADALGQTLAKPTPLSHHFSKHQRLLHPGGILSRTHCSQEIPPNSGLTETKHGRWWDGTKPTSRDLRVTSLETGQTEGDWIVDPELSLVCHFHQDQENLR